MQKAAAILRSTEDRGIPRPADAWFLGQAWCNVLFLHAAFQPDLIRAALPAGLQPDLFRGEAWLSIVVFRCIGSRLRITAGLPVVPDYVEFNLRTYVLYDGHPGIHFFQLRTGSWLARAGARLLTHMPYMRGATHLKNDIGLAYHFKERPTGNYVYVDFRPTVLDAEEPAHQWLIERYCAYQADNSGQIYRYDVRHTPWLPVQTAVKDCTIDYSYKDIRMNSDNVRLVGYAAGVDALLWRGKR